MPIRFFSLLFSLMKNGILEVITTASRSQSSTYFQEWWASSSGASFWTSLWSPGVGKIPEVGWQGAPGRPRPLPQSNPSHSPPCLSQLSPLKTCRTAGSPLLPLSFFHLKQCYILPRLCLFNWSVQFSPFPFSTNWALSLGGAATLCRAEMWLELSASVC